uniref:RNase H type-1 domain-containing protein n=1 Tax=Manihot esculenta TaxID=3983 RepID=A0A2C9UUU7_MANES
MKAFFCSRGSSLKKLHLVNWNTLILPKGNGGLGIKDLTLHNQAFLFKWLWRLNHHSDSLWVQLLKAKYSFQTECGVSLALDIRIAIGNGLNVRFWHDKWFGILALKFSFNRLFNLSTHQNAFIKWNTDGSSKGKPGPVAIGGVLRDSNGLFVCIFSMFYRSSKRGLILESDSTVAISWVLNDNNHLWRLSLVFNFISNNLKVFPSFRIQHVAKEANWTANTLAKRGLHCKEIFIA